METAGVAFTVVGAAKSGLAAANALAARGADVRLVDGAPGKARPATLDPAVAFEAGTNAPRRGDIAVLSPGIPEVSPVRGQIAALASEVIGEVELFFRLCPAAIVAITGTDGKSTTTTMIGDIIAAAGRPTWVGGNLGTPLCESLAELTPEHVVVAEVSCFQLTTCDTFRPRVAVITNIAEDHLDYHGGFANYQAAKRRLWRRMTAADTVVLNGDDPFIAAWTLPTAPRIQRFSAQGAATAQARFADDTLTVTVDGAQVPLMARSELPLLGIHNVANALAAAQAALAIAGVTVAAARRALAVYGGLPHRLRTVATVDGVRWINDSKATNPNAAAAGLAAMVQPTILLAGGSSKDADFSAFGALARRRTRAVVLFGETKEQLSAAVDPARHAVYVEPDLPAAMARARALAEPGDAVLLSPACASYDQFDSYGHRGDTFERLVHQLAGR